MNYRKDIALKNVHVTVNRNLLDVCNAVASVLLPYLYYPPRFFLQYTTILEYLGNGNVGIFSIHDHRTASAIILR